MAPKLCRKHVYTSFHRYVPAYISIAFQQHQLVEQRPEKTKRIVGKISLMLEIRYCHHRSQRCLDWTVLIPMFAFFASTMAFIETEGIWVRCSFCDWAVGKDNAETGMGQRSCTSNMFEKCAELNVVGLLRGVASAGGGIRTHEGLRHRVSQIPGDPEGPPKLSTARLPISRVPAP